jgi:hypothetical protein
MTAVSTNFAAFRDGFGVDISDIKTWRAYTEKMVRFNSQDSRLAKAARSLNEVASSGEVVVLHAALAAADFAWLADELGGKNIWGSMSTLGDDMRTTIAAAILRQD